MVIAVDCRVVSRKATARVTTRSYCISLKISHSMSCRKCCAIGVCAPKKAVFIDAVGSCDDRSYGLIVEQTGVENEVKLTAPPVSSLQSNPINGLLVPCSAKTLCQSVSTPAVQDVSFSCVPGGSDRLGWDKSTTSAAGYRIRLRRAHNNYSQSSNTWRGCLRRY